jgi:hypothetical protein
LRRPAERATTRLFCLGWHENSEHIGGGDSLQPDCARNYAKSLKAF